MNGHIVIVGGGIAGLAAAYRLITSEPSLQVTLIEASERLGGKIVTERVDGFIIEGGPDSFLASKPRGVELSEEIGLTDRLQGVTPRPKRAFILHGGRLHELPEGLTGLVPTRLAPLARSSLLSPMGKARVALDYVLPARHDGKDESLGAFVRRRLGREAWERLVEPLAAGIYAADGEDLSLTATFPQLRDAELKHGGLIRGVLAARAAASAAGASRSAFLTPAGGLDELVSPLESQLRRSRASIRTGVAANAIFDSDNSYGISLACGESLRADAVIIATPAFAAATLLAGLERAVATDLAAIQYASTAIVSLAFRRDEIPHKLDGHGYVVPRAEGSPILACTWSSRKWDGRAPAGYELVRIFIGRAGDLQIDVETADDELLLSIARREVAAHLGVNAAPRLVRVHRWPRAMPQYALGHPDRVSRIEMALHANPGLFLAGSAYHGVGLPDCIVSGERAADMAVTWLRTRRTDAGDQKLAHAPIFASSR
jgi:oxygen-dependent protoporphyrinogen oxidase